MKLIIFANTITNGIMRGLRKHIINFFNQSIIIGMISIISPSVIHIEPLKYKPVNDADAIASDWESVGSYIKNAYDTCRKQS